MYNKTNVHRSRYSSANTNKRTPCTDTPSRERVTPVSEPPSLAMVYSFSQSWRFINDGVEGFNRGTIFDELNKPFYGDKCKCGGSCK